MDFKIKKILFSVGRLLTAFIYFWVVADRVSLLGPVGSHGVVWGNFDSFLSFTHHLNPWAPRWFSDILGYAVSFVEFILAVFLLANYKIKESKIVSVTLLTSFLVSMLLFGDFDELTFFTNFTIAMLFISLMMLAELLKTRSD